MITYVIGDLLKSPADVLVNTVNTVGVMGKGIANDFKKIYPEMFTQYQKLCEKGLFNIGQLWIFKTKNKWVLNFPTKKHWRNPSKIEYIEAGLDKFVKTYAEKGITSISFPMLGCGNGELNWETEVRPLMEKYLKNIPIDIYIHLYRKDPFEKEHRNIQEIKKWLRSEPQSMSFVEVWEDIENVLKKKDAFFTLDKQIGFTAKVVKKPEAGLQIMSEGKMYMLYEEHLVDLWQHIRSLGFLIENSMPNDLERFTPFLVSILQELPYLKPILISSNYHELNSQAIGLQFIPKVNEYNLFKAKSINEVTMDE